MFHPFGIFYLTDANILQEQWDRDVQKVNTKSLILLVLSILPENHLKLDKNIEK